MSRFLNPDNWGLFHFVYFLILGFETRDAIYPKITAAAMPPAAAAVPPVKAPIKPLSCTF